MVGKQRNKEIGDLGETIACNFLKNKGFSILERNYWRKWGELDIVALRRQGYGGQAREMVHFVEVKTVSHETKADLDREVTRLSARSDGSWRPEEQVHQFKLHQIHKAVETWLAEHNYFGDWQIDVVAVRLVPREKHAVVKYLENITA